MAMHMWSVQEILVCMTYTPFRQLPSVGPSFQFVQEIFVHATYVPCLTNNTGAHSGLPQLMIWINLCLVSTFVLIIAQLSCITSELFYNLAAIALLRKVDSLWLLQWSEL